MKTIKILLVAMLLLSSISSFSVSIYTESKAVAVANGYTIATEMYGDLVKSDYVYNWRQFYADTEYLIFACSDDADVTDVDIYIENPNGSIFLQDNDSHRSAVVSFELYDPIQLKIVVFNHATLTPNYASRIQYFVAFK